RSCAMWDTLRSAERRRSNAETAEFAEATCLSLRPQRALRWPALCCPVSRRGKTRAPIPAYGSDPDLLSDLDRPRRKVERVVERIANHLLDFQRARIDLDDV